MKTIFRLAMIMLLAFATSMNAQTVIPVEKAPYQNNTAIDGSGIVLTATNNPDNSTTFSWTYPANFKVGPANYATILREYIGAADTVGACPGTNWQGIPGSLTLETHPQMYTAWDVPVHFNNNTCAPVWSMKIKWNDYVLATNNSPEGCVTFESYAGGSGALVTNGMSLRYKLSLFSIATFNRVDVIFWYTLPMLPNACPGSVVPEAPASITSPSAPAKPGKGNSGKK